MPEGDTIHSIARALRPRLVERTLEELWLRNQGGAIDALGGSRIDSVEAIGKHMLVGFDGTWVLRVHLGMRGTWHHYPPGAPWRRAASTAIVQLTTAERVFVCFNASAAQLIRRHDLPRHPQLSRLGQDLLG